MTLDFKQELQSLFLFHTQKYPLMQPQDAVKLCYQRAFGAAHFCGSLETAKKMLVEELAACSCETTALFEPLDNRHNRVRLSLGAAKEHRLPTDILAKAFVLDAKTTPQDSVWFSQALEMLPILADEQFFGFSRAEMESYLQQYRCNPQAVSHSEIFRNAYHPHYRVFGGQVARLLPLIVSICKKLPNIEKNSRLCVGMDGFCASGKTTAAGFLSEIFDAPVVHTDDFFLPPELRLPKRLKQAGGNLHYERFAEEVAPFLQKNTAFSYRIFNCAFMCFASSRTIPQSNLLFVEGAYAMNPRCKASYDITAFFDVSPELQKARILQRNGIEAWNNFRTRWIPMEHAYQEHFDIRKRADFLIKP